MLNENAPGNYETGDLSARRRCQTDSKESSSLLYDTTQLPTIESGRRMAKPNPGMRIPYRDAAGKQLHVYEGQRVPTEQPVTEIYFDLDPQQGPHRQSMWWHMEWSVFRSASAVNVMIYGIIRGRVRIGSHCDDLLHYPCISPHQQSMWWYIALSVFRSAPAVIWWHIALSVFMSGSALMWWHIALSVSGSASAINVMTYCVIRVQGRIGSHVMTDCVIRVQVRIGSHVMTYCIIRVQVRIGSHVRTYCIIRVHVCIGSQCDFSHNRCASQCSPVSVRLFSFLVVQRQSYYDQYASLFTEQYRCIHKMHNSSQLRGSFDNAIRSVR